MSAPKKFVGLHAHTQKSVNDGFGEAGEHLQFVVDNGMDALAISEHGNINSLPEATQKSEELCKLGRKVKYIPACEFYYHPDLSQWQRDYAARAEQRKQEREEEEAAVSDEDDPGVAVEDEEASKRVDKFYDPVERRHHLVVLPKSRRGLENLFRLVSRSNREGYYRFPRIDARMLKEHSEDLIVSSACIAGVPAWSTFSRFRGKAFDELIPDLLDDPKEMDAAVGAISNELDRLTDAVGPDNVNVEIQFNKLAPQHLANRAMFEAAKRTGLPLLAAADSHYCSPDMWRAREIYKLLGHFARKDGKQIDPSSVPSDVKQLKCELYPKNAEQMWAAYKEYCSGYSFYDDEIVCRAIERSWHLAHDVIGQVDVDRSVKLPSFGVAPGMTPQQTLVDLCKEGMRRRGLAKKREYIERLKVELGVIGKLENATYFLTLKAMLDVVKNSMLLGCGRGSGAGSLVNYVLGITDVDPVANKLIFARFMSLARAKNDLPDVDCLDHRHAILMADGTFKRLRDVVIGDVVLDVAGEARNVTFVAVRSKKPQEIIFELLVNQDGTLGTIVCSESHNLLKLDGSSVIASEIVVGDFLLGNNNVRVEDIKVLSGSRTLVDIEVEETHVFRVIPFDVWISEDENVKEMLIRVDDYIDVDELSH